MNAILRLTLFAGALVLVFAAAAVMGGAVDPRGDAPPPREAHMASSGGGHAAAAAPVRGLGVAEGGLRLVVERPELPLGRADILRFRVVDKGGETVRDFDVEHEKRMHLILARRDLTGFQHLHPTQGADGAWSARVRVDDPGSYRMFADFSHDEAPRTLAADLRVDGAADLQPLPRPSDVAVSDSRYRVRLARAGDDLRFAITRDGEPVETEPYLGAAGHLVALREGDLAFLHVHPSDEGPRFAVEFPTPGRYRLFLQFKHEGRIHTAAFTQEVA